MKTAQIVVRAARIAAMKSESFDAEYNLGIAELALASGKAAKAIAYAKKSLLAAKA